MSDNSVKKVLVEVCCDGKSQALADSIREYVKRFPGIEFQCYNEDVAKEKKKSYKAKGAFAARVNPFCGIHEDGKIIKGFYSEAQECTEDNIKEYLFQKYASIEIPVQEEPEKPKDNFLEIVKSRIEQNEKRNI